MKVITKPCVVCGKASTISVPPDGYVSWYHHGAFIQDAFPQLSADERELLISGTHPDCWDELTGADE